MQSPSRRRDVLTNYRFKGFLVNLITYLAAVAYGMLPRRMVSPVSSWLVGTLCLMPTFDLVKPAARPSRNVRISERLLQDLPAS